MSPGKFAVQKPKRAKATESLAAEQSLLTAYPRPRRSQRSLRVWSGSLISASPSRGEPVLACRVCSASLLGHHPDRLSALAGLDLNARVAKRQRGNIAAP